MYEHLVYLFTIDLLRKRIYWDQRIFSFHCLLVVVWCGQKKSFYLLLPFQELWVGQNILSTTWEASEIKGMLSIRLQHLKTTFDYSIRQQHLSKRFFDNQLQHHLITKFDYYYRTTYNVVADEKLFCVLAFQIKN